MPGPAPKHRSTRARRNNPRSDFRSLPAKGRAGKVPPWPLQPDVLKTAELELARDRVAALQVELEEAEDGRTKGRLRRSLDKQEMTVATITLQLEQATDAEVSLWADLWATPQAVIWEEAHAHREVAQYVRWKVRAEQGDLDAAKEARMLSDRLGLNPLALLRLRAEVENVDAAQARGQERRQRAAAKPAGSKGGDDPRGGLHAVS
ncbi:hypothetical protein [Cellulomonas iranensis]|uniref:hypothetical protein n=1 Tax=Cellulomonas iranensis TaxID=76862 RepID=UPI0013CFBCF5|nr:hypothetical protein [Cellulomonas iranensis]